MMFLVTGIEFIFVVHVLVGYFYIVRSIVYFNLVLCLLIVNPKSLFVYSMHACAFFGDYNNVIIYDVYEVSCIDSD